MYYRGLTCRPTLALRGDVYLVNRVKVYMYVIGGL